MSQKYTKTFSATHETAGISLANFFFPPKMDKSLHLSDISPVRSDLKRDADDERDLLISQINEYRAVLENLHEDSESRHSRYEAELSRLTRQIQDAKSRSASALDEQRSEHAEKLRATRAAFEDAKDHYRRKIEEIEKQNIALENSQREMARIGRETRSIDEQRMSVAEKSKMIESDAAKRSSQLQQTLKKKMIVYNNKQKLKRIEHEVSDLLTTRREIDSEFRLRRNDLVSRFEVMQADFKMLVKRLEHDMGQREKEYNLHLEVTRKRIEKEKQSADSELKLAAEQVDALQKLYQTVSKRGAQQLSLLNQDIEKMKKLLNASIEDQEKFTKSNVTENRKLYNLSKNTNTMRQTASGIMDELTRTKMEKDLSISQIQKSPSNSPRKVSQMSSSNSTPRKQSIFT